MLPDEELHGEVTGVERPGEGPQLRLVKLQAHHLAHAQLHPVEPDGAVLLDMGDHEEQGQLGWRLGGRGLGLGRFLILRGGRAVRRPLRSVFLE